MKIENLDLLTPIRYLLFFGLLALLVWQGEIHTPEVIALLVGILFPTSHVVGAVIKK